MDQFEHLVLPFFKSSLELMFLGANGRRPFLDQTNGCPDGLFIVLRGKQSLLYYQSGGFQEFVKVLMLA